MVTLGQSWWSISKHIGMHVFGNLCHMVHLELLEDQHRHQMTSMQKSKK